MNRLAPHYLASLIMGAWFYMTAVGNFVAGKIGEATGGHDGEMTKQGLLDIYEVFGWIAIGVAVAVLLVSPIVRRWMHLDTLADDPGRLKPSVYSAMPSRKRPASIRKPGTEHSRGKSTRAIRILPALLGAALALAGCTDGGGRRAQVPQARASRASAIPTHRPTRPIPARRPRWSARRDL